MSKVPFTPHQLADVVGLVFKPLVHEFKIGKVKFDILDILIVSFVMFLGFKGFTNISQGYVGFVGSLF